MDELTYLQVRREARTGPGRRTFHAVAGGVLLYSLLLINFPFYEASLGVYAFRLEYNPAKIPLAIAMIAALGLTLALAVTNHRSSVALFSQIAYAVLFVPLCVVYTVSDGSTLFTACCGSALALCFISFRNQGEVATTRPSAFDKPILIAFSAIAALVLVPLLTNGSAHFGFVQFNDVYALRADADIGLAPEANRLATISAYGATSYLMMYGLLRRKYIPLLLGFLNAYLMYTTFGFKLFLFFPFIVLFIFLYLRSNQPYKILYYICAFVFFSLIVNANELSPPYWDQISDMITRRWLYTPGFISFAWYETFSQEPYVLMSNVPIFRLFFNYPFDTAYSRVVAMKIFVNESNPNTSVLGYGFANFGYPGIFLYALFAYGMLAIIDNAARRIDSLYLKFGAAPLAFLFLEADPIVVLLSFGLGVALISGLAAQFFSTRKLAAGARAAPIPPVPST